MINKFTENLTKKGLNFSLNNNTTIRPVLLVVLILFTSNVIFAQGPPPPPPPPGLPVDGGLIILFLAAIGYASKKLYSK